MRIVIIAQDEPFAVPVLLEEFVARKAEDVAAIAIAPPTSARESFIQLLRRWWQVFGPLTFLKYALRYLRHKLGGPRVQSIARRWKLPLISAPDINAPEFLDRLRELQCDLIISVASPQIFRRELLELPRHGCINVHSGPLPRYRGQLPTFWALFNHEPETAVTVHYMNERVDDGAIILQKAIPITEGETHASLMRRCKRVGGKLLAEAVDLIEAGKVVALPNPREEATYYSFPTAAEAREFRRKRGRWV